MSVSPPSTLSVEEALRQALSHHQAGRLHEAEQLYRAILQAQPGQSDANHNLGVLAGQVGQQAAGLPYLRAALEANPAQGQHWLSYADALLATGQAGEALRILQTGLQRGLDVPGTQALLEKVKAATSNGAARGDIPYTAEINQLAALFNAGRYAEMESQAGLLIARYPDAGVAWKALGQPSKRKAKWRSLCCKRQPNSCPMTRWRITTWALSCKDSDNLMRR